MKRRFSNHNPTCCCMACTAESGAEDAKAQDAGDSGKGEDSSAPRTYRHPAHAPPAGGDGGSGEGGEKPIYSLEDIHTQLTTNWEDHPKTPRQWMSKEISYYIATDPTRPPDDRGDRDAADAARGFNAETAALMSGRHDFAALAFELWDDLIHIDLNETKNNRADITIAYTAALAGFAAADVSDDGRQIEAERIWISTLPPHAPFSDFTYVSQGYNDFLHEIGHTLGLSHPGPYNVIASYGEDAVYAQDTRMFTVMSYFGAWGEGATPDGERTWSFSLDGVDLYPSTPMLHDIYAIQQIYGADPNTRAGDTIYGFNSTADRPVFRFDSETTPILTIWDGGGHDTLDVSGYGQDQFINLVPGTYSNIGALTQNVAIAFNCWIEDAVGGTGGDRIEGNIRDNRLAGGDGIDTIFGGDGEDTIDGGAGADAMYGGNHDDTFLVDHLGDFILESPDGGYDTAEVSVSGYTLDAHVERGEVVNTGGGTFTLTGNDLRQCPGRQCRTRPALRRQRERRDPRPRRRRLYRRRHRRRSDVRRERP